jgi:ribonucleoside-diphosphate reductase alpha chain
MSLKALQDYTFVSRYARHDPALGRRETWEEAVDRVAAMHRRRYPSVRREIDAAFELVRQKRVLGSQRALQFGGAPIEENHARLYNCTSSFCNRLRFFPEAFYLTLCGCGVGFSVQGHHVARLPAFARRAAGRPRKTFVVPDSLEGWADALGVLLSSYFEDPVFPEFADCDVRFDYRLLDGDATDAAGRPPEGRLLRRALEAVRSLLDRCREDGQTRLRPIDAYDLVMHTADAVAGPGVRRSAAICVFSPDDEEMLAAKTGNWVRENPPRARSNNSCLLLRHATTRDQFRALIRYVREFGEPGFIWADSTEYLVNPCCEIGMWPVDEATGESGWQFCNLAEINGALVRSREDLARAARAAAHIGTWQAGYTDFPYLGPVSERITRREAHLEIGDALR